MDCREFKQIVDSYISDELLVETNHEVLRHLENCADCRRELATRRALRIRFCQTIKSAAETRIDPAFMARVSSQLRESATRMTVWDYLNTRIVAVGFACVLFASLGSLIWLNVSKRQETANLPVQSGEPGGMQDAIRVAWSEMTTQAAGDHENCAVEFRLTEDPVSLDEAAVKYGAFNKDLDKTIATALNAVAKGKAPDGIELLESHSCLYAGRRFAHIVFWQNKRIISVLVTDTDLPADNTEVQTAHFNGTLNAAGFHIGHHAVFVVSDLPDATNMTIARDLVPAIRLHAEKLGA